MNDPRNGSVAMIGLGLLGTALAERLLGAGFEVVVYNRTREKAEPLVARGARWSDRPLAECSRAVVCLYRTEHVVELLAQMETDLRRGQAIIDTTTGEPNETAALGARLAEQGISYLETPIAASSEQTRRGEALAILGGERSAIDANADLLDAIAPRRFHVGPWGAAARMKLVNNLILGLNRVALAEGLLLAEGAGLDPSAALEVLKNSNSRSAVMDVKGRKMVERDFAVEARLAQHRKDVDLILAEGRRAGLDLPVSSLHRELLVAGEEQGLSDADNSAIIAAIEAVARRRSARSQQGSAS
ncbi:MAG: NAD(P)-dependent oxidoreductase [Pirellulales bacterium]|nr:NAD(P)-dependent oxidoreductase [Pirellulales bacterium]